MIVTSDVSFQHSAEKPPASCNIRISNRRLLFLNHL